MSNYNSELLGFEMEVDETFGNVSGHHDNVQPAHEQNNFEPNHSHHHQNILFDENQTSNFQGEDLKSVRNIVTSTRGTVIYPKSQLNEYLNYNDSSVESICPSTEYVENNKNHSLDEFFHDLYEINSTDMKTPSKEHEHGQSVATLEPNHAHTFNEETKYFHSHGSDVEFNLDLTQFNVNTPHESDMMMLQSPVSTDFASHFQAQYEAHNENGLFDNDSAMVHHSNGHATELGHVNTDTIENGQLKEFYLDFNMNGDVASGSHVENSIITYMRNEGVQSLEDMNDSGETQIYIDNASNDLNKEGLQNLEYISGETGTVVYVDQTSSDQEQNSNGQDVTQFEMIDFDAYQSGNTNSTMQTHQLTSLPVENADSNKQFTFYDECRGISYQADVLKTLLSDKNNKIILIAKPLKNPKIRSFNDKFNAAFNEIIAPNILFSTRPIKRCRKQKLELVNQIDSPVPKSTERRDRDSKIIKTMLSTANFIPETPKLPSQYMRDHKKTQVKRRKPRKLIWDSDSDCDNTENCNDEENSKDV